MRLADPLAHRHHDALPAHHGAQAQRDGDADLDPERNEARALLQAAGIGLQGRGFGGGELGALLGQQADGIAGQIHVVAQIGRRRRRHMADGAIVLHIVGDVARQDRKAGKDLRAG